MNETGLVAKFLPRQGLDAGIDVTGDFAVNLGHHHHGIVGAQLRAQELAVSGLRTLVWREEAMLIELEMCAHQRCAELAEGGEVAGFSGANGNGHVKS